MEKKHKNYIEKCLFIYDLDFQMFYIKKKKKKKNRLENKNAISLQNDLYCNKKKNKKKILEKKF